MPDSNRPKGRELLQRNNVQVFGDPSSPDAIIFAHGFGTDHKAWSRQVEALQDRYRCITFDHVGSGASDPESFNPRRYSSLYSYAYDLIEICNALDLRHVRLVGHSVGGMVSMIASILRPELFSSLLVIGPSPRYLNDPPSDYYGGFNPEDVQGLFDAMAANYHAWASGFAPLVMGNPDRPALAQYFCETLLSIRPDIAQAVLKVIFMSDHRQELQRVEAPVHLVMSTQDVAVPDVVGDYLASHLRNSRLIRLEATGHLPHISAPKAVNEVIEAWLSS